MQCFDSDDALHTAQILALKKIAVMAEMKSHFRPEFINRIDEIVLFHALGRDNIKASRAFS